MIVGIVSNRHILKSPGSFESGLLVFNSCRLQRRVVDVTNRTRGVEQFRARFVQRCISLQTCRQVRVGNERYAECDCIGLAAGEQRVGAVLGETLVGNVRAAEGFL